MSIKWDTFYHGLKKAPKFAGKYLLGHCYEGYFSFNKKKSGIVCLPVVGHSSYLGKVYDRRFGGNVFNVW